MSPGASRAQLPKTTMFKNASIFRIVNLPNDDTGTQEYAAELESFTPLQPSNERSTGWAPARGQDNAALVERVDGHDIMRFMCESKSVPGSTIAEKAKERAKQIEATTGRKPGKKEMREIKDDVKLALLPVAFPHKSSTLVWIDRKNMLLVVDSASSSRTDDVVSLLVRTFDGLKVQFLNTLVSPTAIMQSWLLDQGKLDHTEMFEFSIGRSCRLKATDETKAVVSYNRHDLDRDDLRQHLEQGKLPVALELTHNDRVSFVLTSGGEITKIKFLDLVFSDVAINDMGEFETDVAIMTGELSAVIAGLVDALGGEVVAS